MGAQSAYIHVSLLEFDLDSDELSDDDLHDLESSTVASRSGRRDQRMPLLVGLFDSSASRRSSDSFSLARTNGNTVVVGEETLDLDEIAAKRTAGGGMLDSIANMANSILGAGMFLQPSPFISWHAHY